MPSSRSPEQSPTLTETTLRLWQSRTKRPLTGEDARQITANATGFFRLLLEWDSAVNAEPAGEGGTKTSAPERPIRGKL